MTERQGLASSILILPSNIRLLFFSVCINICCFIFFVSYYWVIIFSNYFCFENLLNFSILWSLIRHMNNYSKCKRKKLTHICKHSKWTKRKKEKINKKKNSTFVLLRQKITKRPTNGEPNCPNTKESINNHSLRVLAKLATTNS